VTVFMAPGEPGPPRVAVVAGRKVGSAVRRNRAKRRLREAVAGAPVRAGFDYLVVASAAVLETGFEEVVDWVCRAARPVED
jgi:ribonuclease P protein component